MRERPAGKTEGAQLPSKATLAAALACGFLLFGGVPTASAGVGLAVTPTFPSAVVAGDSGRPASLTITNVSTPPEHTHPLAVSSITLAPSCGAQALASCPAGQVDPGVFSLSATGAGVAGTACAGVTFNIVLIDPAEPRFQFTPTSAVTLGPPGTAAAQCVISFTFDVLKAPTRDAAPATPGLQTVQLAAATATSMVIGTVGTGSGSDVTTVNLASPTLAIDASDPVTVGGQISATATVSGAAANPTGTVTFTLFRDATCTDALSTSTVPLTPTSATAGTATSSSFTTTAPGTYRWIASYSGDANNAPAGPTACGDPAGTVVVSAPPPPGGRGGTPPPGGTTPGVVNGTPGNDTLVGTSGNDVINCGDGDDVVNAGGGNDVINCGPGNDRVDAGAGNDRVDGGSGNDQVGGGPGTDGIVGGSGNDVVSGGTGNDAADGSEGDDTLSGNEGADLLRGSAGNDRIFGNEDDDTLDGGAGQDRLAGNGGRDRASGGAGRDTVGGGSGDDRLSGGGQADRLSGDSGRDNLSGGAGPDRLFGGAGRDVLNGGSGNDRLRGGPGRDRLIGGPGRDSSRQ